MSTNIEWTRGADGSKGETWNPIAGCSKISPGCTFCYAIKDAHRLAGNPNLKIAEKYEGTTKIEKGKMNWTGKINLASDEVLTQPYRWTRSRKIFVNSMSDLFHEKVPFQWIDKIFAVMALSSQHTFQILTKRADIMQKYFQSYFTGEAAVRGWQLATWLDAYCGPQSIDKVAAARVSQGLPNVWLGVSCENQDEANKRIPYLFKTPAAVRFLSCEPLLEYIDLQKIGGDSFGWGRIDALNGIQYLRASALESGSEWETAIVPKIDQVIVGGESGSVKSRPMDPDWVRSMRDQCTGAVVPFFFKQFGDWTTKYPQDLSLQHRGEAYRYGKSFYRVGKKLAGRTLDGRTWDEFPVEIK